ncbi:hypothetical protein JCM11491_003600 [Sporobolomyces phaffii]
MSTSTPPRLPPKSPPPIPPPPPPGPREFDARSATRAYPPSPPARHDHIVPIRSLPPSPQTPTRRAATGTNATTRRATPEPSPRTPSRGAARGRSTSIDFKSPTSHYSLDFADSDMDMHDRLRPERDHGDAEDEPLMLPFNYPSTRRVRSGASPSRPPAKTRRQTLGRIIGACTVLASVICWLGWTIVAKATSDEADRATQDDLFNFINSRFEKQYNETTTRHVTVDVVALEVEEEEQEEGGGLGRDGDTVLMTDGQTFVYRNAFGGTFIKSTSDPSLAAKAQNDTPSLAEEWDYESMTISGVNLGGWLTLEPFITPAIFEPFLNSTTPCPAVDEYTLSQNLLSSGGPSHLFDVLDHHYATFITEQDFAEIAGAGLNWVRIPFPYWSISKWTNEPFLERTSWKYFLKALEWSKKYGLRVNLDLHSVPGSQNGWNHSGKWGPINWLHSTMGYANAQRSLDYIETLAEFVSRPDVAPVVKMLSLLNEPMMNVIGTEPLRSFYAKAYRTIRAQTGYSSGPVIAMHDGFKGTRRWFDFPTTTDFRDFAMPTDGRSDTAVNDTGLILASTKMVGGMDRVAIDSHRYLAFSEPDTRSVRDQVLKPCQKWAPEFNKTFNGFGIPLAGEFSIAVNDCGRFLNNVDQGTRIEGTFINEATGEPLFEASVELGSCAFWEDYENWSDELKADLRDLAYAEMDTFQNWFYWTWKTAPSLETPHRFANPLWSYSLGLEQGWIPRNPRLSANFCYSYAERNRLVPSMPRRRSRKARETMEGWKVGRYLAESQRSVPSSGGPDPERYPWPPEYFNIDPMSAPASFDAANPKLRVEDLPRYRRTAAPVVLPGPTSLSHQPNHHAAGMWYAPIEGCRYPDTWASGNATSWSKECVVAPPK